MSHYHENDQFLVAMLIHRAIVLVGSVSLIFLTVADDEQRSIRIVTAIAKRSKYNRPPQVTIPHLGGCHR